MKNLILIVITFFLTTNLNSQEKKVELKSANTLQTGIGVVDMKKILSQSTAYQSIVEQFEDIRRKHRNTFTKQEDVIRDEESNLLKQKNIISKEAYADKVKQLNQKINELKSKQASDAKKFENDFEKSTNKIQGLDLVLAKSQVLLVGKEIDITDQAIQELNKVLPKISLKK